MLCTLGLMQNTYPVVKISGTERIISDDSQASMFTTDQCYSTLYEYSSDFGVSSIPQGVWKIVASVQVKWNFLCAGCLFSESLSGCSARCFPNRRRRRCKMAIPMFSLSGYGLTHSIRSLEEIFW